MEIGNKIMELRKKNSFSQEYLAEKVGVSRQTISKWELGETAPDIKQAKELSKIFNISLDELVGNDIKSLLVEKTSNTEKLAGIIINILKALGILILAIVVLNIVAVILFTTTGKHTIQTSVVSSVEVTCSMNDKDYNVEVGSDGYFNCVNCSKEMIKELKDNYIDYGDIPQTSENINNYFEAHNGKCD